MIQQEEEEKEEEEEEDKWMFTCNQRALTIHSTNGNYRTWKIKNGHPPTLLFITLPLGCQSRICLLKPY